MTTCNDCKKPTEDAYLVHSNKAVCPTCLEKCPCFWGGTCPEDKH